MAQVAVVAGAAVAGALAGKLLGGGKSKDATFQADGSQNHDHESEIKKYAHLAQECPEVRAIEKRRRPEKRS
jgi:hypothetical protein